MRQVNRDSYSMLKKLTFGWFVKEAQTSKQVTKYKPWCQVH